MTTLLWVANCVNNVSASSISRAFCLHLYCLLISLSQLRLECEGVSTPAFFQTDSLLDQIHDLKVSRGCLRIWEAIVLFFRKAHCYELFLFCFFLVWECKLRWNFPPDTCSRRVTVTCWVVSLASQYMLSRDTARMRCGMWVGVWESPLPTSCWACCHNTDKDQLAALNVLQAK